MINPIEAKEFAEETIKNGLPEIYSEYYVYHSAFVIRAAKELAKDKGMDIPDDLFEIVGYLHDIGYTIEKKGHAKHSLKLAEEHFGHLDEVMKDCILNHGRSKSPTTQEGKIFQLADKLSSFYPEFIEKLIDLEKREGKTLKETLEDHKKRLKKSLSLYEDEVYKKMAKKYFDEFLKKY